MGAKHAHVIDYIAVDVRPGNASFVFGTASTAKGILIRTVAYTITLDGIVHEEVDFDMPTDGAGSVVAMTGKDRKTGETYAVWTPRVWDQPTRVIFLYTHSSDGGKTWTPNSPLDEKIFVQHPEAGTEKPSDVVVNITPTLEGGATDYRNATMTTVSMPLTA